MNYLEKVVESYQKKMTEIEFKFFKRQISKTINLHVKNTKNAAAKDLAEKQIRDLSKKFIGKDLNFQLMDIMSQLRD